MPTVPQYNIGQVQSTGVNGTQSISAPADAFGGNVARAQVGFGQQMAKQADVWHEHEMQMQEIYEKGVLRELDNNYTTHITEALHDPENGFLSLSGRNALDAKDSTFESITEYRKSLEKDLNPRMLRNWNAMADVRTKNAQGSIYKHSSQELINYNKVELLARIENSKQDAINNKEDPVSLTTNIQVMLNELKEQIQDVYGIDSENPRDEGEQDIVNNEVLKHTSAIHASIIDAFINEGSPEKALKHFKTFESAMLPEVRAKAEKLVSDETLKSESQRLATEIIGTNNDFQAQLKEARKIEDADLQDMTVTRIKARKAEDDAIEKDRQDEAYSSAQDTLANTDSIFYDKSIFKTGVWETLSGPQKNSITAVLNARKNAVSENIKNTTEAKKKIQKAKKDIQDQVRFNYLRDLAKTNFKEFSKVNLNLFRPFLTTANLDTLKTLKEKGPEYFAKTEDLLKSTLTSLGYNISNELNHTPEGRQIRAFKNELNRRLLSYQQEEGGAYMNDTAVYRVLVDMAAEPEWRFTQGTNEVEYRKSSDELFAGMVSRIGWDIADLNTHIGDGSLVTDFKFRVNQLEAEHWDVYGEKPHDQDYQKILNTAYYDMIAEDLIKPATITNEVVYRANTNDQLKGLLADLGLTIDDYDKPTPAGDMVRKVVGYVNNQESAFWFGGGKGESANDMQYRNILENVKTIIQKGGGIETVDKSSFTTDHKQINKQAFIDVGLDQDNLEEAPDSEEGERARNFNNRLTNELEKFYKENTTNPTRQQWQVIVNDIVGDKVFVEDFGGDELLTHATVPSDELKNTYVEIDGKDVFLSEIKDRLRLEHILKKNNMRSWEADVAKLSLIPEGVLKKSLEKYYLKKGEKKVLSADLLYANYRNFVNQKESEKKASDAKKKLDKATSHSNKIITNTSNMTDAKAVKALKSHTSNILNKINWENDPKYTKKAKKHGSIGVKLKLMQKELDTINDYLDSIKGDKTHDWDLIFSTNVNDSYLSLTEPEGGESITNQYQNLQVEALRKRKEELEGLLQ